MCDLFTLNSTLYFSAFLLSVFLFPFFHLSYEQQPELYKKNMENLCDSANNGCEGTYDLLYSPQTVEVGHVEAHRSIRERQQISLTEKFIIEGNEKADELTKAGARLDEGDVPDSRASTLRQEREEVHAALQYAASFHCLVEEWKDCAKLKPNPKRSGLLWTKGEAKTHRTEWCAAANIYRCMRCGRISKQMNMPGTCEGPRWLMKDSNLKLTIWGKRHLGEEARHGKKS